MIVKIIDAIRLLFAILVAVSTIAVIFLLVKKNLKDKLDKKQSKAVSLLFNNFKIPG
jgi:hypothetical protein